MLSPIPSSILRDKVVIFVPIGIDKYQMPVVTTYEVANVHLQADNTTHKTAGNTEVTLRGILFVDARRSQPALDWTEMQEQAHAAGSQMTLEVYDRKGKKTGPYTVVTVDALPDDEDNLHHYEIGVV